MNSDLETPSAAKNVNVISPVHETGNTENFNPLLGENVIERDYTGPNISQSDIPDEIPEPTFTAPPLEDLSQENPIENEPKSFNPEFSELDDKSKKQGAEMMADAILDGYSTATLMLGKVATISESKLDTEIAEGAIDPQLQLPIDENNSLTVKEFVTSYNESASEAFSVDAEFKETVRAPLIRVLMKRGVAMTDEQFLIYHFAKDILFKGVAAFQLKSQNKQILNMLRESTNKNKLNLIPTVEQEHQPIVEKNVVQTSHKNNDYEEKVFSTESNENGGFKQPYTAPPGTPSFGDQALLAHMEAASKTGNAKASNTKVKNAKASTTRGKNATEAKND